MPAQKDVANSPDHAVQEALSDSCAAKGTTSLTRLLYFHLQDLVEVGSASSPSRSRGQAIVVGSQHERTYSTTCN